MQGEGVTQMSILLHKAYLLKWPKKQRGKGDKNVQNCPHDLWMTPCYRMENCATLPVLYFYIHASIIKPKGDCPSI